MKVSKSRHLTIPHREVAILLDKDTVLLEDESEWPYACVPKGTKVYAHKKLVHNIFYAEKFGQILKYDGDIIKWRDKCPSRFKSINTWANDPKEVNVSNSRSFPENPIEAVRGYAEFRDWIESYGGNVVGTMASSSWSLFKTTLPDRVWETPFNGIKEINHPIGGRLLPCKSLRTTFIGDLIQFDLYSAYSRRLSEFQFGGPGSRWKEVNTNANFDNMVERGMLVYIEATVKLGEKYLGPLPKRRTEYHPRPTSNISYPRTGNIEGIWTYEEIRAAINSGARVRIKRAWIHLATGRKYYHEDWYRIIQEGRNNLSGFARGLAKQTGNALWGRYAMRIRPARTVWRENGKRVWSKHAPKTSKKNQCMELADQLCGKIRSDLYEFAISANDNLLQGNTDGAWINYERGWLPPSDDWRIKRRSNRIDILDDATYRYWEEGSENPTYVVPGINTEFAEKHFDMIWNRYHAS